MIQQKIAIAKNLTFIFPAGADISHVLPMPAMEYPCLMEHVAFVNGPSGDARHKIAQSVKHKQSGVIQSFHDCGRLIPHIGALDVIVGPLASARTVMFSAMKVQVESEPIGFANLLAIELPTPMLTCGLIPLPLGFNLTAPFNTVIVGMEGFWDWTICAFGVAIEMVWGTFVSTIGALLTGLGPAQPVVLNMLLSLGSFLSLDVLGRAGGAGQTFVEWARSLRESGQVPTLPADMPASWPAI